MALVKLPSYANFDRGSKAAYHLASLQRSSQKTSEKCAHILFAKKHEIGTAAAAANFAKAEIVVIKMFSGLQDTQIFTENAFFYAAKCLFQMLM